MHVVAQRCKSGNQALTRPVPPPPALASTPLDPPTPSPSPPATCVKARHDKTGFKSCPPTFPNECEGTKSRQCFRESADNRTVSKSDMQLSQNPSCVVSSGQPPWRQEWTTLNKIPIWRKKTGGPTIGPKKIAVVDRTSEVWTSLEARVVFLDDRVLCTCSRKRTGFQAVPGLSRPPR